jgi:hypothetical protein
MAGCLTFAWRRTAAAFSMFVTELFGVHSVTMVTAKRGAHLEEKALLPLPLAVANS